MVRMTADGQATLAALNDAAARPDGQTWDVVLLDARMPAPDGLEVLRRIRQGQTGATPDQRVILYTAALDNEAEERCRDLRPDVILLKPASFALLRQRLAALLQAQCGGEEDEKERAPMLEKNHTPDEVPLWEREAALAAMDGDREIFAHLLAVLREDLRKMLTQLEGAVSVKDAQCVRRLAHACKNSAGTMRLMRLHATASQTEKAEDAHLAAAAAELVHAMREALALLDAADADENGSAASAADQRGRA